MNASLVHLIGFLSRSRVEMLFTYEAHFRYCMIDSTAKMTQLLSQLLLTAVLVHAKLSRPNLD